MIRTYEYEINSNLFLNLIEVCKKVKSQIVVCLGNTPQGVMIYGFHETIGLMKTIQDDSKKIDDISIPVGIAIESKYLNAIEKEIKEKNIETVSVLSLGSDEGALYPLTMNFVSYFIFSKNIRCGDLMIPLLDFNKFFDIGSRVVREISYSIIIETKELTNDPEFLNMCDTKTENGVSQLHIGSYLLYIAPNMLNIVAGDEVSITIYSANVGNIAVFTINRKKKKCILNVILRIMDMRKQG
jgi:hypothetical protein